MNDFLQRGRAKIRSETNKLVWIVIKVSQPIISTSAELWADRFTPLWKLPRWVCSVPVVWVQLNRSIDASIRERHIKREHKNTHAQGFICHTITDGDPDQDVMTDRMAADR